MLETVGREDENPLGAKHPKGWMLATLSDVIVSVRGGYSVKCDDRPAEEGEVGVLKTGAVITGRFEVGENKFVPLSEHSLLRTPVSAGTIIICRKNSEDTVGASALIDSNHPNIFLSDLLWELRPANGVSIHWLISVLHSRSVRAQIQNQATGTQSTMKNISQDRFLATPILLPPLPEQRKIAQILRAWDEAIDTCDRLIDRLERRFSATARRFFDPCHPTFERHPNSCSQFELGDVFAERTEGGDACDRLLSITMSGGIIDRDDVGRKDTSTDDKSSYKLILAGDIGYNTMRMWQGVCGLSMLRGIVSPAYTIVTPDNVNIAAKYAAHLFKSRRMVFDFERYSQGLTSDTWNLKFPAFSKIKLFLPPIDIQHQQAELLDVLKGEIEVLYRKREALANQKRGLMQKLLTGEWRVKVDKEAAA